MQLGVTLAVRGVLLHVLSMTPFLLVVSRLVGIGSSSGDLPQRHQVSNIRPLEDEAKLVSFYLTAVSTTRDGGVFVMKTTYTVFQRGVADGTLSSATDERYGRRLPCSKKNR